MSPTVWVNFPVSATNIAQFNGATCCDAFYTDDDKDRHVLVAVGGGTVYEVFYSTKGIGTALLRTFNNETIMDVAGFYSSNDKSRHAVVSYGAVYDLTYHPALPLDGGIGYGVSTDHISAFYNPDTHNNHAIYLDANSQVRDIGWTWKRHSDFVYDFDLGIYGNFFTIKDLAGFYTSDDKTKHAILGCTDGNIIELYWSTNYDEKFASGTDPRVPDIGQTIVAQIPGSMIAVAAFYVKGNQYSRRVVVATDQGVFEVAYDPHEPNVRAAKLLVPGSAVLDIGGFYSPDDNQCHAILLLKGDGVTQIVQEVYYPA